MERRFGQESAWPLVLCPHSRRGPAHLRRPRECHLRGAIRPGAVSIFRAIRPRAIRPRTFGRQIAAAQCAGETLPGREEAIGDVRELKLFDMASDQHRQPRAGEICVASLVWPVRLWPVRSSLQGDSAMHFWSDSATHLWAADRCRAMRWRGLTRPGGGDRRRSRIEAVRHRERSASATEGRRNLRGQFGLASSVSLATERRRNLRGQFGLPGAACRGDSAE